MTCPVSGGEQEVTSSEMGVATPPRGLAPDSTTAPPPLQLSHSNAVFAAALTAKLDSLTAGQDGVAPRGSPAELADCAEYENPDSMETQGDALCGSGPGSPASRDPLSEFPEFDLTASPNAFPVPDCDPDSTVFQAGLLPTFGPLPDPSTDTGYDETLTGSLFSDGGDTGGGDLAGDGAVEGSCGLRNLGNTCYMNSGLQCLLACPPLTQFFLAFRPTTKESGEDEGQGGLAEVKSNTNMALSRQYGQLVQAVYSGQFTVIQPNQFKESLSESHEQFKGFRQHDCQEFLALLLDSLHEQLVGVAGGRGSRRPLSECTSMELHTPHSTETSQTEGGVFSFSQTGRALDREGEAWGESVSEVGRPNDLESVTNIDGMESRGSASPKSYTSHSSLEDKVLPAASKNFSPNIFG